MILPLSLKLLAAGGLLLLILLITWKKRRKILWPLFIIVAGVGIWQGLKEFNRTNKDPNSEPAKYEVNAADLLKEFESGDSSSLKKYDDQIIEVSGMVKEIKKDSSDLTIMMGDTSNLSAIQCEMNIASQKNAAELSKGSSAKIKGHFVGFRKGEEMMGISLGSTISMNRCILIKNDK